MLYGAESSLRGSYSAREGLLGNTGPFLSTSLLSILIITQIALLVLESAVASIQSYVFAVLRTLYSSEVS